MFDVFHLKNNFTLMIIAGHGVKYRTWSIPNTGGAWPFLAPANISRECPIMEAFRTPTADIPTKIDITGVR